MIDIKLIRERPEEVKKMLQKRHSNFPINKLIEKDTQWRQLKKTLEEKKHEKNKVSEQIAKTKPNQLIKQTQDEENQKFSKPEQFEKLAQELKKEIKQLEEKINKEKQELDKLILACPAMLDKTVPEGKTEKDNPVIRIIGEPKKYSFELKNHAELIEQLNIGNFEKAAQTSGRGFNYLFNDLALLDLALQKFAIDFLMKKGHSLITPPLMLNKKIYEGVVDLTDFENVMYKIQDEENYLIATAEHPLIALFENEVLDEEQLPLKLVGLSPAFRKEIGAHGVDTRGLFRMHQFNKVEQIIICKPEDSKKALEELHTNAEELYKKLEIPFRTIEICAGDLSIKNAKQYDIEAWFPRQQEYKEVGSSSNCVDFQSRALNIKFGKRGGAKEFVHTLNATGIATSRALVAILENNQNEKGEIEIPKLLIPYMNGKTKINTNKKIL